MEKFFESLSQPSAAEQPQNVIERFFDAIGLMRGSMAPFLRVGFGFTVSAALLWYFKPAFAFAGNAPRPWRGASGATGATWAAWWLVAAAAGLSLGLFV